MELDKTWNILFVLVFGLIAGLVESFPMDMDSIKDQFQMGVLTAVGMTKDFVDNAKVQGSVEGNAKFGPLEMGKKMQAGAGMSGGDDDRRKRKRRSVNGEENLTGDVLRLKRSPCRRRTTTVAPAAGGGAEGAGTVPGGAGEGEANPDDLRRRRKRSPYDEDDANNIYAQQNFPEGSQEFAERARQFIKGVFDSLANLLEKFKTSIRNAMNNSSPDYDVSK